jgi:6-phosphogluconolactonase (cycloisomerase 2 family)
MATASVSTPDNPRAVTVDPSGRYLYVGTYSGNGDNDIPTFAINADGSLVPLASPSGDLRHATPISLAIDPWTERLYAGSLESTSETLVQQLTILADGTLSFIVGDWVRVPSAFTKNITVDPLGRSAYLVDSTNNVVLQFARRSDNGSLSALTPASVPALGTNAQSIALDPLGRYAYVGAAGFISQYSVDDTNGALSSLTPGAVSAGEISAIATDHSGRYAYALGWGATEGKILQYTIGSDGTLTPMTATSVDTIARPVAIAVSP